MIASVEIVLFTENLGHPVAGASWGASKNTTVVPLIKMTKLISGL